MKNPHNLKLLNLSPGPSPRFRIFQFCVPVPVPDPEKFEFEARSQSRILKWVSVPGFRDQDCGITGTLSRMQTPGTNQTCELTKLSRSMIQKVEPKKIPSKSYYNFDGITFNDRSPRLRRPLIMVGKI